MGLPPQSTPKLPQVSECAQGGNHDEVVAEGQPRPLHLGDVLLVPQEHHSVGCPPTRQGNTRARPGAERLQHIPRLVVGPPLPGQEPIPALDDLVEVGHSGVGAQDTLAHHGWQSAGVHRDALLHPFEVGGQLSTQPRTSRQVGAVGLPQDRGGFAAAARSI